MKASIKSNKMFGEINYYDKNIFSPLDTNEFVKQIEIAIKDQINEAVMEELFTIYKNSNVSSVYVISRKEFENYLNETLPKYLKEDK